MYLHRKSIIIIGYLIFFSFLYGQTQLRYTGPFQLGEYNGNASYQYSIWKGDTLLNGPFQMQSASLDALLSKGDSYFSIDGSFNESIPDSTWQIRFGEFAAVKGTEFIDYHFIVTVSGTQHTANINFANGQPQGEWIYTIKSVDNSTVTDTVFKSLIRFNEGIPQGIIRIEDKNTALLGRFQRNGFAHDIWELDAKKGPEIRETWYFVSGRLEKIVIQKNQNKDSLMVYVDEIQRSNTVNLDERYLQILSLQNIYDQDTYEKMGGAIASLIKQNTANYARTKNTLNYLDEFAEGVTVPMFSVKAAYFPLGKQEWKLLEEMKVNLQYIDTTSTSLLGNTRLKILQHSDDNILFLLSTVKEIAKNYISEARKVVQYEEAQLLDFFPRKNIQVPSHITPDSLAKINVSYKDSLGQRQRTFLGPNASILNNQSTGLVYLTSLTKYARACVDSINRKLNKNLKNQTLQQELSNLEKDLLTRVDHLSALIDSLSTELSNPYLSALQALQTTANKELRNYSVDENTISKPEQVRILTTCMEELEELAIIISKLPDRGEEIQQLYTEEVWNPFTATIMNDQVKERIYKAYDELLIPSILEKIEHDLNCENIQEFHSMLNTLYKRMQQYRKQNTSKLERKLKNENDPQVVMKLFEITM